MTGLSSVVLALLCVCGQMVAGAYLDALLACLVPELRRLKHLGSGGRGVGVAYRISGIHQACLQHLQSSQTPYMAVQDSKDLCQRERDNEKDREPGGSHVIFCYLALEVM